MEVAVEGLLDPALTDLLAVVALAEVVAGVMFLLLVLLMAVLVALAEVVAGVIIILQALHLEATAVMAAAAAGLIKALLHFVIAAKVEMVL
jgi:hypothetical protein